MCCSASFTLHEEMKIEDVVIKVGFYDHLQDLVIILKDSRGDDDAVTHSSILRKRT